MSDLFIYKYGQSVVTLVLISTHKYISTDHSQWILVIDDYLPLRVPIILGEVHVKLLILVYLR